MSVFMSFTKLLSNKPILLNLGAITALETATEVAIEGIEYTKVHIGTEVYEVKEPIQAFFQKPPQQDPPDSGKAEVSTEGVPI